jgi:O-antigen/teichoic acid export membrane protein
MAGGLRSLAANTGYLFAARTLANILRAAYVVALARAFGPELYGTLAYGQSWYGLFVPLTALGFAAVLSRETGHDRVRGQALAVRMLALRGPLILLAAILCAGIGWAVNTEPEVRWLLYIFSLALVGRATVTIAEDIFAAFEISHLTFRQEAMFRPAEVGLGLAILAAGGGMFAIAALHAAAQIIQGARGLLLVHRHVGLARVPIVWPAMGKLLAKALLAGVAGMVATWLLQGPLVLYAQSTVDKTGVGQLALVLQALVLLCNLPWAIGRAALPVLSGAKARRDGSGARYAEALLRLAFMLAAALGLAGMAMGPWLMESVFGAGYTVAGTILGPALWLLLPLTAATALNPLLMVRERYGAAGLSALAGAGAMIAAVPALSMSMGPAGAIAGAGAGLGLWALCLLAVAGRREGIAMGLAVIRPGIIAAAGLGAYLAMTDMEAGPVWSLALAWLVLLFAGVGLCVTPDERRALWARARR